MDYLEIILKGYFDKTDRLHLTEYLYREFKKAEKEYFTAGTFFDGCMDVIDSWKKHLQREIFERKDELYLMLTAAKNGTLTYDNLQGKTIEQKRLKTIEYCKQELKDVRPDGIGSQTFTVLLPVKYGYSLSYNEILYIKTSIDKASELTKIKFERKYLKKAIKKLDNLIQPAESDLKKGIDKITELKKTKPSTPPTAESLFKDEGNIITILKEMFPNELYAQLQQINDALQGQEQPEFVKVTFVGTKTSLYKYLGKIRNVRKDISRTQIATVFEKHCSYKKNNVSDYETLKWDALYRKMGIKQG